MICLFKYILSCNIMFNHNNELSYWCIKLKFKLNLLFLQLLIVFEYAKRKRYVDGYHERGYYRIEVTRSIYRFHL